MKYVFRRTSAVAVALLSCCIAGCAGMNTIPGGSFKRLDQNALEYINKDIGQGVSELADQSLRPNQKLPELGFLVATSGGGQRAAAFTMGVLYELQNLSKYSGTNELADARAEIDYFSSVSGGGWATGAYITAQLEHQRLNCSAFSLDHHKLTTIRERIQSLEMSWFSNCLVEKLEQYVTSIDGSPVKYGDILLSKGEIPMVPFLFNNSTIESSHSPFVFNGPFIEHYSVEEFGYCGKTEQVYQDITNTPISIGIATSSSVPGFRFTQAKTSVCDTNKSLTNSWLCNPKPGVKPEYMHLYDGGVFDNLGYKTGLEVLSESSEKRKVMLVIDANADTYQPIDTKSRSSELRMLLNAGVMSTLAVNAITAQKSIKALSRAHGVDSLVLGFYSASGYLEKAALVKKLTGKDPLEGLINLRKFVDIDSKKSKLLCDYSSDDKTDCYDNQYYRIGLSSKTSHKIGDSYYDALQDLGRLVVRLYAHEISHLLLNK